MLAADVEAETTPPIGLPDTCASVEAVAQPGVAGEPLPQLPRGRRLSGATLTGLAAVAGVAALVLGSWAFVRMQDEPGPARAPVTRPRVASGSIEQVVSLLAKPSTERIPLAGSVGRIVLVVGAKNNGVLVLDRLGRAPGGKSYQAWVVKPGAVKPTSAALFDGSEVVVPLATRVPAGATVAVTLEPSSGSRGPTRPPRIVAQRSA